MQCGLSCLLDLDDFASVDFVGLVRVVFSSPHQLGLYFFEFAICLGVRSGLMKTVLYLSSVLFRIYLALLSTFFLSFILFMTARIILGLV